MVYESDFYTTRRPYSSRPLVSSYTVTSPIVIPISSSIQLRSYYPHMPYVAHKRLVTIVHTPVPTFYHHGTLVPIRVNSRVRPSVLSGELNRIRALPRPSCRSATEHYLNSKDHLCFDDETREIRAKADSLLRRIHVFVPRPCASEDYIRRLLGARKNVKKELELMPWYSVPEQRSFGDGHLACVKYCGGKAQPRRKPYYTVNDVRSSDIKNDVNLLSYYSKNRIAAEKASHEGMPPRQQPVKDEPVDEEPPSNHQQWVVDEVVEEQPLEAQLEGEIVEEPPQTEVEQVVETVEVRPPSKKKEKKEKKHKDKEDRNVPKEEALKRAEEFLRSEQERKKLEEERQREIENERLRLQKEEEEAKLALEKAREAARRAEIIEQERLEAQRRAEEEKLNAERVEAERIAEEERINAEAAETAARELEERLALEQREAIIADEEDRIARIHEEDNGNAAQESCDDVQEIQESNESLPQQDFEPTVVEEETPEETLESGADAPINETEGLQSQAEIPSESYMDEIQIQEESDVAAVECAAPEELPIEEVVNVTSDVEDAADDYARAEEVANCEDESADELARDEEPVVVGDCVQQEEESQPEEAQIEEVPVEQSTEEDSAPQDFWGSSTVSGGGEESVPSHDFWASGEEAVAEDDHVETNDEYEPQNSYTFTLKKVTVEESVTQMEDEDEDFDMTTLEERS